MAMNSRGQNGAGAALRETPAAIWQARVWAIAASGLVLGTLLAAGSAAAFTGDATHWARLRVSNSQINPLARCANGGAPLILIKNVFDSAGAPKTSNAQRVVLFLAGGGDFRGDPADWNRFWNIPSLADKLVPTNGVRPDQGIFDYTNPDNVFFTEDYRIVYFDECASDGWMGSGTRVPASAGSISRGAPSAGFYASGQLILDAAIGELKHITTSSLNPTLRGIGNLQDLADTRVVIVGGSTGAYGVLGNLARLKLNTFPAADVRAIADSYFPIDLWDYANGLPANLNFRPNSDVAVVDARKTLGLPVCVDGAGYLYASTRDCVDATQALRQIYALGIPLLVQHNLRDKLILNQTENWGLGGLVSLYYCMQLARGGPTYGYCDPARVANPSQIRFARIVKFPEKYTDNDTMEQKVWDSILTVAYAPKRAFISRQASGMHTLTPNNWFYDWTIERASNDLWSFADMVKDFLNTAAQVAPADYILGQSPVTGATYIWP